jgi:adenylate cyclase
VAGSDRDKRDELTLVEAARLAGVSPSTLRRWGEAGVIPRYRGRWTRAAAAHARIVARLREHGYSLEELKRAGEDGRLAFGYVEELFPQRRGGLRLEEAAKRTGLEPALIRRIWRGMSFSEFTLDHIDQDDIEALEYISAVLAAGFPLVAFLQLMRVYGYSMRQIADAESRLWNIYVREPLLREGVPGTQMAEELQELVTELLPLSNPFMEYLHRRYLRHFVEQDVMASMEADLGEDDSGLPGQRQVTIAFADLAGFVRFTEEAGEEEALDLVESFVGSVEASLPDDARVMKNIGDGVMIVGTDPAALTDWAIGFQQGFETRSRPRIGIHHGRAIYRDGDYYGSTVNLAARVVSRAQAGEVLVTEPVYERISRDSRLDFEPIGRVRLKGFFEETPLYAARPANESSVGLRVAT